MPSPSSVPARQRRSARQPHRRLWLIFVPLVLLGVVVVGLFGLRWWVNSYLRSPSFRRTLDRQASQALDADGKFGLLQWQGAEVFSDAFDSVGNVDSPLARLSAEQIRARLDFGALWHRTWRVDEISVQRFGVTLSSQHPTPDEVPPVTSAPPVTVPEAPGSTVAPEEAPRSSPGKTSRAPARPGFLAGFLPNRFEIGEVKIEDFSVAWDADRPDSLGKLERTRLSLRPVSEDQRSWQITGAGGRLSQAHLPPVLVKNFSLKTTPHELFITGVSGQLEAGGRIDLSGRQGLDGDRALDLQADFEGLPVAEFLPVDWRARLRGTAAGSLHITGRGADEQRATGHLELRDGRLAALPVLDQLAVFTASERYRQIPIQKAQADFDWNHGNATTTVKNLLLESEGLLRIEGGFVVRGQQIDGTLQVGVARPALRWLAVVGTQVFEQPERDGYLWTTVRLHGPINHPTEDLSPRLIAAVQEAAIKKAQQGADGVIDAAKTLLDLLH